MENITDLRKLDISKLSKKLLEVKKSLAEKKLMFYTGKDKNTSDFKGLRKDIARILTVISEKEVLGE